MLAPGSCEPPWVFNSLLWISIAVFIFNSFCSDEKKNIAKYSFQSTIRCMCIKIDIPYTYPPFFIVLTSTCADITFIYTLLFLKFNFCKLELKQIYIILTLNNWFIWQNNSFRAFWFVYIYTIYGTKGTRKSARENRYSTPRGAVTTNIVNWPCR